MSLEDFARQFLEDPEIPSGQKEGVRALMEPHLAKGRELQAQGQLREAIEEYSKEHTRSINSHVDADIVQASYWFKGRAYRELGEVENAIATLQKSRELLKTHGVGASPHEDLAELFISQGRYDEAIEVCQECLEDTPAWSIKQLLAQATNLKEQARKQKDEPNQP